jgi:hypothetical protein
LAKEGIDYSQQKDNRLESYLPLEMFDDVTYDPRTPEEWQSLGVTLTIKFVVTFL